MSLVARALEEAGIATVVIGSALDIVEYCGVPRFLFTDFPLGNPCGRPYDGDSQRLIMAAALDLLRSATAPNALVETPLAWASNDSWKDQYMHVGADNIDALRLAGEVRRAQQAALRGER